MAAIRGIAMVLGETQRSFKIETCTVEPGLRKLEMQPTAALTRPLGPLISARSSKVNKGNVLSIESMNARAPSCKDG